MRGQESERLCGGVGYKIENKEIMSRTGVKVSELRPLSAIDSKDIGHVSSTRDNLYLSIIYKRSSFRRTLTWRVLPWVTNLFQMGEDAALVTEHVHRRLE
jgi:hypothetical protein